MASISRFRAFIALLLFLMEAVSSEQDFFGRMKRCIRCPEGTHSRSQCPDDLKRDCQPCSNGYYWSIKNGIPVCRLCTQPCSGADQLVEVTGCSLLSNRQCRCQAGWFCETHARYTCTRCQRHRECEPGWGVLQPGDAFTDTTCQRCPAGHYSNQTSSTELCRAHTNCSSLGQAVFLQGSDTRDGVCVRAASSTPPGGASTGQLSTSPAHHDSTAPSTTVTAASTGSTVSMTTDPASNPTTQRAVTTETTEPHPPISLTNMITPPVTLPITTSSTAPPSGPKGSLESLAVFISVSLICCLLLLLLKNRRRLGALFKHSQGMTDMKLIPQRPPDLLEFKHKQQDCPLLAAEGERQESREPGARPPVEEVRPLGRAGDGAPAEPGVFQEPCSDSWVQQFIVEPKGGDSVNNNIGSIFILHPSTVILGSGRGGIKRTGGGEGDPPISTPQQESQSQSQSQSQPDEACRASVCVQEEGGKELHYPIPASGK
ncbi:tumor necrosis factor receptor superfamily member 1B [Acipenser ruthenus]|uniref:tumor necrosis factor receptor superfamily member 1B n=1 Tax=Acipenser ruthenus TaxID=7906 RepID=UPI00274074DA|nr:tumor necrosis factor receptor superfamily member 1B [Acipenser ruthenus]